MGTITAERVLEMATIDGARAIGRADELGSLEAGKRAGLTLVVLDYPHPTPHQNVASGFDDRAELDQPLGRIACVASVPLFTVSAHDTSPRE